MRVEKSQYYGTNFTGITKAMSRSVFIDGKKDISILLSKYPKGKDTHINELPPVIFNALPKNDRISAIKEFIAIFDNIANEIRAFKPSIVTNRDEYVNKRPRSVVEKLKKIFQKYNLLENPENFDFVYIGEGEYKKAFRIVGVRDPKTKEELCYKIFHVVDKSPEWHKYKSHGNFAEINISAYWHKHVGQETQRGKIYFGDINNGYLIDRYVDETTAFPKKNINEYDYGIKITDEFQGFSGHNKLQGYSIDPGGSRVVNRIKNQSKTARYVKQKIEKLPVKERIVEWYRMFYHGEKLDKTQKYAGLALAIKDVNVKDKSGLVDLCLGCNEPLVDQGLAYVLKYLPEEYSKKYFEILLKRKDPVTQTVLLNEIPLLSKKRILVRKDDLDVPRGEIDPNGIEECYNLAQKYVIPEVEEHLASYIHLLPKDKILPEAENLILKHDYNINDRLLHKIKFVKDEEFPFDYKMKIIDMIEANSSDEFILKKAKEIRTKLIRDSLGDD